jgi:hypothetical protein
VNSSWIDIKERLPRREEHVMMCWTSEGQFMPAFFLKGEWFFNGKCVSDIITHWIGLPDPPMDSKTTAC